MAQEGVAVLVIWTPVYEEVRDVLNPILERLYREGKIRDHPDGASQGWEWKP